jgi:hypothetical protein
MLQYPDLMDCSDGQPLGFKSLAFQYRYIKQKESYWQEKQAKLSVF